MNNCDEAPAFPAPSAGQLYSFRTSPCPEGCVTSTGRFAVLKILSLDDGFVVVSVLDGIWSQAPTLEEVQASPVLMQERPYPIKIAGGRPVVFRTSMKFWKPDTDLDECRFMGLKTLSPEDEKVLHHTRRPPFLTYSSLSFAGQSAEGEWRWANERAAFTQDLEAYRIREDAAAAAKLERYKHRLRKLSWGQLQMETPFLRWPSSDFTAAARMTVRKGCEALEALGPKPRRADVRAVLKDIVHWFNEADEKAGGVILTQEREDICAKLEEIAYVARQKDLVSEIDLWREW